MTGTNGPAQFEVESVDVRDDDGDADLGTVEFTIEEGGTSGAVSDLDDDTHLGSQYKPDDNLAVTIEPNDRGETERTGALTTTGTGTSNR